MMAVIHWKINGVSGHGSPTAIDNALAWMKEMNSKYGAGTHWLEYV